MKKEADVWMKKAEKDLLAAGINLRSGLYDVASFLSQQSAEKALKAVYISRFERLWKIHDLAKLGKEIDAPLKILEFCDSLNPHYIASRYPVDASYTEEMAEEAVNNAEEVVTWAKKELQRK